MTFDRKPARMLLAAGGMIAWAAQFTVIYGVASVLCARGYGGLSLFGIGIVPLTIAAATILALGATVLVLAFALRERRRQDDNTAASDRFLAAAAALIAGLSLVTIVWQGLPALIVPVCE